MTLNCSPMVLCRCFSFAFSQRHPRHLFLSTWYATFSSARICVLLLCCLAARTCSRRPFCALTKELTASAPSAVEIRLHCAYDPCGRRVSWMCLPDLALFGRGGGGIFTKTAAVGVALSIMNEYRLEEDDKHNIVGDTLGDIAVLLGSFAETTCATQVFIASSDTLENSWGAGRHPVLFFSVELRWKS